jgi:hypothetical protein
MHTEFPWESHKERPRHRQENNIKMDLREKEDGEAWTAFTWLRMGISGGLL